MEVTDFCSMISSTRRYLTLYSLQANLRVPFSTLDSRLFAMSGRIGISLLICDLASDVAYRSKSWIAIARLDLQCGRLLCRWILVNPQENPLSTYS